jgi:N-acetylglucosamine-1-phosphodiester alpha-N-acetylglucosaminidase
MKVLIVALFVILFITHAIVTKEITALHPYEHFPYKTVNTTHDNYVLYKVADSGHSPTPIYHYNQSIVESNVVANVILVENPKDHFRIQPPLDGCGTKQKTSDNAMSHKCVAATNAGFFNVQTGACIGNVVTDGKRIQHSCLQHANFGVLNNGSYIIGYMTCETIHKLHFDQLVTGVLWLVRDGKSFVNHSIQLEQASDYFVDLKAPRVAIGHDVHGRLLMVQVDGNEAKKEGFDVHQMTKLMLELGAVNAINLDGGGSSTLLINKNQVKSTCTDKCTDPTVSNLCPNAKEGCCERRVTTIVCVH